jgi:hypothetical protein
MSTTTGLLLTHQKTASKKKKKVSPQLIFALCLYRILTNHYNLLGTFTIILHHRHTFALELLLLLLPPPCRCLLG